jgi:hypothetical protein
MIGWRMCNGIKRFARNRDDMLLASAIFAFFCYKRQLASVGDALLETQPEHAEKARIEPEGTGKR